MTLRWCPRIYVVTIYHKDVNEYIFRLYQGLNLALVLLSIVICGVSFILKTLFYTKFYYIRCMR